MCRDLLEVIEGNCLMVTTTGQGQGQGYEYEYEYEYEYSILPHLCVYNKHARSPPPVMCTQDVDTIRNELLREAGKQAHICQSELVIWKGKREIVKQDRNEDETNNKNDGENPALHSLSGDKRRKGSSISQCGSSVIIQH